MANVLYKTRLPIVADGNTRLALIIGTPLVTVGDVVNVRDLAAMVTERDLYVKDVVVTEIVDTPHNILTAYGHRDFSDLRLALSHITGTALPAEATITVLVLTDMDSGIESLYEEEVEEEFEEVEEFEEFED